MFGSSLPTGGGVLAYTLLGIDWNRETGGTRYLILDPHYTGADDVSSVIAKGWCAWKVRVCVRRGRRDAPTLTPGRAVQLPLRYSLRVYSMQTSFTICVSHYGPAHCKRTECTLGPRL